MLCQVPSLIRIYGNRRLRLYAKLWDAFKAVPYYIDDDGLRSRVRRRPPDGDNAESPVHRGSPIHSPVAESGAISSPRFECNACRRGAVCLINNQSYYGIPKGLCSKEPLFTSDKRRQDFIVDLTQSYGVHAGASPAEKRALARKELARARALRAEAEAAAERALLLEHSAATSPRNGNALERVANKAPLEVGDDRSVNHRPPLSPRSRSRQRPRTSPSRAGSFAELAKITPRGRSLAEAQPPTPKKVFAFEDRDRAAAAAALAATRSSPRAGDGDKHAGAPRAIELAPMESSRSNDDLAPHNSSTKTPSSARARGRAKRTKQPAVRAVF